MTLPAAYQWLTREGAPKALMAAVALYGTLEGAGAHDNPTIVAWADEVAKAFPGAYNDWAADFYAHDQIAWCGLFQAVCEVRAGRPPAPKYLSALAWASYGTPVARPMLSDLMIKTREGGGHVTRYVGEDATHYHCLGGNQSDAVSIARYPKSIPWTFRRDPYRVQPANVRVVHLAAGGAPEAGKES